MPCAVEGSNGVGVRGELLKVVVGSGAGAGGCSDCEDFFFPVKLSQKEDILEDLTTGNWSGRMICVGIWEYRVSVALHLVSFK